jgi:hypothetical protein
VCCEINVPDCGPAICSDCSTEYCGEVLKKWNQNLLQIKRQIGTWQHWKQETDDIIGLVGLDAEREEEGMKKKSDEYSRKIVAIAKLAERYGVKVKESSVGSIGFVGGVRRPEAKSVDDDNPAGSPKPSVN